MDNPENVHTSVVDDDDEHEEFFEEFQCCVCLDLIYKPVVLACGHISCFWCVFGAMDLWKESRCPVCRHFYNHFPSICWLLHFLLLKLYPKAYKRRESQVAEEEKKSGTFSPQVDNYLAVSGCSNEKQLQSPAAGEGEDNLLKDLSVLALSSKTDVNGIPTILSDEAAENLAVQENSKHGSNHGNGPYKQVFVSDLLCAKCKQLLYRPLVLNCGHVFCEVCIVNPCNELCHCLVCQSMHPNGFPKVCLILEHFLEEHVSEEYASRRAAIGKLEDCRQGSSSTGSAQTLQRRQISPLTTNNYASGLGRKVHFGVGCDCCGMTPIIGERYKCRDCLEEIGFDLCEDCYKSSSKLPGRFNQQHKPEHEFEILQPMIILTTEMLVDHGPEINQAPSSISANPDSSSVAPVDPDGGGAAPVSSNGASGNQ